MIAMAGQKGWAWLILFKGNPWITCRVTEAKQIGSLFSKSNFF